MAQALTFESGGTRCAATFYRPPSGDGPFPCVVMGHGFTGTQDQLTVYAECFAAAGIAALTFDYRSFGLSAGHPRQVIRLGDQLEDWRAAVALARSLEVVDPRRVALWGSSLSGGHVLNLAAEDPTVAAVVAQVPAFDKSVPTVLRETRAKMRLEGVSGPALLRLSVRSLAAGLYDACRGLLRMSPYYLPVFGGPGEVAAFTDRDSYLRLETFTESAPTWRNEFAPRFLFGRPRYVEGTAERVGAPLLVCVADRDTEADPALARKVACRAPHGVLRTYPVRHFEVYVEPALPVLLEDQVDFLRARLLPA